MKQKLLWVGLLCFVALVVYSLMDHRHPIDFEIPQGYVGEVRVDFSVVGAPPLPIQRRHYIARIPANGLLKTSTAQEEGGAADRWYYVNQLGQRTPIDGFRTNVNLVQNDRGRTNDRRMFIGTRQQSKDAGKLIGGGDTGPLKLPTTADFEQNPTNSLDVSSDPSPFQLPAAEKSKAKKP